MSKSLDKVFIGLLYYNTNYIPPLEEPPVLIEKDQPIYNTGYIDGSIIIESNVDIILWINSKSIILKKGKHFIPNCLHTYTSVKIDKESLDNVKLYHGYDSSDFRRSICNLSKYMFIINNDNTGNDNQNNVCLGAGGIMEIKDEINIDYYESKYCYKVEKYKQVETGEQIYRIRLYTHDAHLIMTDPEVTQYLTEIPDTMLLSSPPAIDIGFMVENLDILSNIISTKYDVEKSSGGLHNITVKVEKSIEEMNQDIAENNNQIQYAVNAGYIYIKGGRYK